MNGSAEILQSTNSIALPDPYLVNLTQVHSETGLKPDQEFKLPLMLYAARSGENDLSLLIVYREVSTRKGSTSLAGAYFPSTGW